MESDERFEAYVVRFSKCHHITIEQAKQYAMVREVKRYYEEEEEEISK